eukprot:TRINITY_DN16019_c0_g1_i1.p1 TRINITY_DN16019_c0_g1~~TRINITY_DN16019_c0_g1_i1.p1  ORF type:complete len:157 (-),score=24.68 TRINITY_DN16019_c0_g1_i1:82-552(-)
MSLASRVTKRNAAGPSNNVAKPYNKFPLGRTQPLSLCAANSSSLPAQPRSPLSPQSQQENPTPRFVPASALLPQSTSLENFSLPTGSAQQAMNNMQAIDNMQQEVAEASMQHVFSRRAPLQLESPLAPLQLESPLALCRPKHQFKQIFQQIFRICK